MSVSVMHLGIHGIPCVIFPNHDNSKEMVFNAKGRRKRTSNSGVIRFASASENSTYTFDNKRKVVEHICLLKANKDLSEQEEKDMLDYLYTSQYHMRGIVAISVGRTTEENPENYTHAMCMRFHRKEDLAKFYESPFYLNILKEHVTPHCHDLLYVDFEDEVQDDILAIFRKGEEFNYGVEFVLLIKFLESAVEGPAEDVLASLADLVLQFPSLIVQSTQGRNFNPRNEEYTHGVLIRFRSVEAQQIFLGSSEYKHIWESKLQPLSQKSLCFHFLINPVGTELM
ncbi:stress-response A/B barrel domain-containing protein UP3 [Silene latifolia]|uniref:stress-response A/B barrel domain-containing protein UP3 n=1 Tax=Silene latifolia TaxID=37657 RepID=UPI003D787804